MIESATRNTRRNTPQSRLLSGGLRVADAECEVSNHG